MICNRCGNVLLEGEIALSNTRGWCGTYCYPCLDLMSDRHATDCRAAKEYYILEGIRKGLNAKGNKTKGPEEDNPERYPVPGYKEQFQWEQLGGKDHNDPRSAGDNP